MNEKEKMVLEGLIKTRKTDALVGLKLSEKIKILDALIEYVELTYPRDLVRKESPTKTWKRELLMVRAGLKTPSPQLNVPVPKGEQPNLGHGSQRLELAGGYSERDFGYIAINPRFAFHDLFDYELGYPAGAQIEMGTWGFRYYEESEKFRLEEFAFAKAFSLNPKRFLINSNSWYASLLGRRIYDNNCYRCFAGIFEFGRGPTWEVAPKLFLTTFFDFEFAATKGFEESQWRVGAGPRLHIYYNLNFRNKLLFDTRYKMFVRSRFNQYFQSEVEYRHNFHANSGVGVKSTLKNEDVESSLSYYHFF